jgi:hypothetical protein
MTPASSLGRISSPRSPVEIYSITPTTVYAGEDALFLMSINMHGASCGAIEVFISGVACSVRVASASTVYVLTPHLRAGLHRVSMRVGCMPASEDCWVKAFFPAQLKHKPGAPSAEEICVAEDEEDEEIDSDFEAEEEDERVTMLPVRKLGHAKSSGARRVIEDEETEVCRGLELDISAYLDMLLVGAPEAIMKALVGVQERWKQTASNTEDEIALVVEVRQAWAGLARGADSDLDAACQALHLHQCFEKHAAVLLPNLTPLSAREVFTKLPQLNVGASDAIRPSPQLKIETALTSVLDGLADTLSAWSDADYLHR